MQERKKKMSEGKKEREGERSSKSRFKSICIFGGSNIGKDGGFVKAANELGAALAARNINLVYGGGIQGLKSFAVTSAVVRGSKVLGVLIKNLDDKKFAMGTEIRVLSMPERMGCMLYNADAFIALPGGLETLDGVSSISYWAKLNFHKKPLGLLNINGFYDGLLFFLDHAVEQGFIPQVTRRAIMTASTADQLIDQMESYAPQPDPLLKQIDWQSLDSSKKKEPDTTLRL